MISSSYGGLSLLWHADFHGIGVGRSIIGSCRYHGDVYLLALVLALSVHLAELAELSQWTDAMDRLFLCSDFLISCPSESFLRGLLPSYRLNSVARSRRSRLARGSLCWYHIFTRWGIVVAQYIILGERYKMR